MSAAAELIAQFN